MHLDAMDAKKLRRRQSSNRVVAKCIPVLLTGIVVYSSWVFVGPLCVEYLINTPSDAGVPKRFSVGIALPIVYFVLLIPMAVAYFRLLYIVFQDPGYIAQRDLGHGEEEKVPRVHEETTFTRSCTSTTVADEQELMNLDYDGILKHGVSPPSGIEEFWMRDVFVCDSNGLPLWCPTCRNWKPDRSHHSSDVGRCVTKMDHFCPWVGGMVGENGFKFFMQFTLYATAFSAYVLIALAYFVAESERKRGTVGNVHWAVGLGLAGFFGLFTFGLNLMSTIMIMRNLTTIENLDQASRTMFLAVLLPPELQGNELIPPPLAARRNQTPPSRSGDSERPLTSDLEDPSHSSYFSNERMSRSRKRSKAGFLNSTWQNTITYPLGPPVDYQSAPVPESRTFAILQTPTGMNPWDLGPVQNFCSVFGHSLHDWLIPLKRSPCTDHSNMVSYYALGYEFERLLDDARLVQRPDFTRESGRSTTSSRRRRKRRLESGWQNGERPDGWILEKEIRRSRRKHRRASRQADIQ